MSSYRIGVLNGDGIGPEVVPATVRLIDAAVAAVGDITIEWVPLPMGWEAIESVGDPMPETVVQQLGGLDGWILGPHDSVAYPEQFKDQLNPSGTLRQHFDLYANIRPSRNLPGVRAMVSDTDLVVVRENTEGMYADRNMYAGTGEYMPTPDIALLTGVFTRTGIERIAHAAFRLARTRRNHVTIVHKANVLRWTTGMYRDICRAIGAEHYPEVEVDDFHIDAMAAHLVRRCPDFDVIVTENMFGDILSDLTGELVGALGTAGSINAGDERAMAQAAHGSAPDIAGQDRGNPLGLMVSGWMLLRWLAERHDDGGMERVATACETAVFAALEAGVRTSDIGGDATTTAFTDAAIERVTAPAAA